MALGSGSSAPRRTPSSALLLPSVPPHDAVAQFIGTAAQRRRVLAEQRVPHCPINIHVALFLLQFFPLQAGIHSFGLGIAAECFGGLSFHPVKPKKHRYGTVLLLACAVLRYQDRHVLDRAVVTPQLGVGAVQGEPSAFPSRRACLAASSRPDPGCEGLRF